MTCFLISPADSAIGRMAVLRYADRVTAIAASTKSQHVVETEADVLWTGPTLVEVYNAVTGLTVRKFESNDVGRRRLLTQLDRYAEDGIVLAPTPPTEPDPGVRSSDAKMPARPGRASKFADDDIVVAVVPNPKKKGSASYARYSHWSVGQTVVEALRAGVSRADLSWDTNGDRAFVRIARADSEEAVAAREAAAA